MSVEPDGDRLRAQIEAIVADLAPRAALDTLSRNNETIFDQRAPWYEKGSSREVYLSPDRLLPILAARLVPGSQPVLDLACGTGFMGQRLRDLGHDRVTGCDLSQAMLDRAALKGIYHALIRADLHQPLPFASGSFASAVCAGAFFADSVAPDALAHVIPVLQPGGWLICDVELTAWDAQGFGAVFEALLAHGILSELQIEQGRIFAEGVIDNLPDPGCTAFARFVAARRA